MHRPERLRLLLGLLVLAGALAGCTMLEERLGERRNLAAGPGDLARDFLSGTRFTRTVIELDHAPDAGPNAEASRLLTTRARQVLDKPGGVTLETDASIPAKGASYRYSIAELRAIEAAHRSRHTEGDTAALYVLYLDGAFERDGSDARVLGVAYQGSSIAIFKGNVRSASRDDCAGLLCPPGTDPEERFVERAVLIHEFGHILGLVNHGIPMVQPHEDANSPGHSTNERSVMYYAVESTLVANLFDDGDSIPNEFDAMDKADMNAAKG